MTSVERMLAFTKLPQEESGEKQVPLSWPSEGKLELRNMSLRYPTAQKDSLRNISLVINSREKIGVVGRTGAGKSSLLMGIFRLVEPTPEGSV